MTFDACIDLLARDVPRGMSAADAVRAVRQAVEALPGASWIDVEFLGEGFPPRDLVQLPPVYQVRVWQHAGSALFDQLTLDVRTAALAALATPGQ